MNSKKTGTECKRAPFRKISKDRVLALRHFKIEFTDRHSMLAWFFANFLEILLQVNFKRSANQMLSFANNFFFKSMSL